MRQRDSRAWRCRAIGGLLLAALAAGCQEANEPSAAQPRVQVGPHGELTMIGLTMGPIPFKLTLVSGALSQAAGRELLSEAHRTIEHVNVTMSTYLPASDLSRLNAAEAGAAVRIAPGLLALLEACPGYTSQTQGAFDPTARPLFELWKAAGKRKSLPSDQEIAAAQALVGWQNLALDRRAFTAVKAVSAMQIDLGGIAKGYAVDLAMARLSAAGAAGALAEIAGEVSVVGSAPGGGPWVIGILNPFDPERLCGKLAMTGRSVSTSGNYFRYVEIDGRRYSHIVDPRTGRSADAVPSVTVIAEDNTTADAWATALSILGPDGLATAQARGLEVMMIVGSPEDYRIVATPGFAAYLHEGRPIRLDGE